MRFLVLGGTAWLGGELAKTARAHGHEVTCLARGESGDPPPGVRWVSADRSESAAYDDVRDESWDEVVDVSWQPGLVRSALDALGERARHWTYVSSGSVYARDDVPGSDESAETHEPLDADVADWTVYGQAKAASERACADAVGDRLHVSRVGLIAGPGDRSDRFGYWPGRFALAAESGSGADVEGSVLAPDAPEQPTQSTDVRDFAEWLVTGAENGLAGTFNVTGEQTPFGEVLAAARKVAGHEGGLVLADPDWLVDQGVDFYMGPESLPLWLHGAEYAGHSARSDAAARAAGLRHRPQVETLVDSLASEREKGLSRDRRAGLSRERELELLRLVA